MPQERLHIRPLRVTAAHALHQARLLGTALMVQPHLQLHLHVHVQVLLAAQLQRPRQAQLVVRALHRIQACTLGQAAPAPSAHRQDPAGPPHLQVPALPLKQLRLLPVLALVRVRAESGLQRAKRLR